MSWFDFDNVECKRLLLSTLRFESIGDALTKKRDFKAFTKERWLSDFFSTERPVWKIFFFGHGSSHGFYAHGCDELNLEALLPHERLNIDEVEEKYFFAYCCQSAEYLERSDLRENLRGGLFFDGDLPIVLQENDRTSNDFWHSILYGVVLRFERSANRSWSATKKQIAEFFEQQAYKEDSFFRRILLSDEQKIVKYLNRLFLLDHRNSMRDENGEEV